MKLLLSVLLFLFILKHLGIITITLANIFIYGTMIYIGLLMILLILFLILVISISNK